MVVRAEEAVTDELGLAQLDQDIAASYYGLSLNSFFRNDVTPLQPFLSRYTGISLLAGRMQGSNATRSKIGLAAISTSANGTYGITTANIVSSANSLSPSAPTAATVGVASAQILAIEGSRKGLVLTNTSANYISLGFAVPAVLYSGITLNPFGGTWVMDTHTQTSQAINAIASAAGSNIAIQSFL